MFCVLHSYNILLSRNCFSPNQPNQETTKRYGEIYYAIHIVQQAFFLFFFPLNLLIICMLLKTQATRSSLILFFASRSTFRSFTAIIPLTGVTFFLGYFIEYSIEIIGYIFVVANGVLVSKR